MEISGFYHDVVTMPRRRAEWRRDATRDFPGHDTSDIEIAGESLNRRFREDRADVAMPRRPIALEPEFGLNRPARRDFK